MSDRRPGSLLWRYGTAIIALQAIVLFALGAYAYVTISRFHDGQKLAELSRLTDLLAERYGRALAGDERSLQALAESDRRLSEARITVILPDGTVVADSHRDAATMDNHRFRPEIDEALATGAGSSARYSQTVERRLMYYARAIPGAEGPAPVLRVALPIAQVDAQIDGTWRTLAIAGVVFLLVTSALIYLVSRHLAHTITELADGAVRFASGQLQHRITTPPVRELERLTKSLNTMASQLGDRIDQLQRRAAEQRAILESMSNGVLALDRRQHVLSVNPAAERILGLPGGGDVRGMLLPAVVREPALHRFVEAAMTTADSHHDELPLGPDRRRRIRATSEPLTDPRGAPTGVLIVLDDVTELRRLESLRSDFAANVSHELRTPITNIKGYVETLQDIGLSDGTRPRQFLNVIKENADRLAAIIDDILALTRIEEPGASARLRREDTPVRSLLQSVMAQFRPAAGAKSITLRCVADEQLRACVQRQLMEQAVGNLLSNAINYSPAGTTVTLAGRPVEGGMVELTVADEGPGIAPPHLPRLFERFYRVDRGRSRSLGGTGLGLAIVKHVALLHGGRAEVSSVVGSGSTFRIVVPESDPTTGSGPPEEPARANGSLAPDATDR